MASNEDKKIQALLFQVPMVRELDAPLVFANDRLFMPKEAGLPLYGNRVRHHGVASVSVMDIVGQFPAKPAELWLNNAWAVRAFKRNDDTDLLKKSSENKRQTFLGNKG